MAVATSSPLDSQFRRFYREMEPLFKKPKMRASTAAVFSFLAVSLFLWYAVRPTAQTIIYLQREIADKTVLNQQMEAKISALIDAQSAYENIKDRLLLLDQALPSDPVAINLAKEIRNIAVATSASISAVQIPSVPLTTNESSPGASLIAAQKPLQEFTMSVVVTGPYASVKNFLTGLLALRRITRLDMITIKPISSLNSTINTLQLSVRLKSYYSIH